MRKEQTCCVTGHRDISPDQAGMIRTKLRQEILNAIREGYTHFISGFANGTDLIFAEIVVALKGEYPITLEAAIPCSGRMNTPNVDFQRLIGYCDVVKILSERYFKGCFMRRNCYMVDASQRVIAVYDGRATGGTAATVRYAIRKTLQICVINTKPVK